MGLATAPGCTGTPGGRRNSWTPLPVRMPFEGVRSVGSGLSQRVTHAARRLSAQPPTGRITRLPVYPGRLPVYPGAVNVRRAHRRRRGLVRRERPRLFLLGHGRAGPGRGTDSTRRWPGLAERRAHVSQALLPRDWAAKAQSAEMVMAPLTSSAKPQEVIDDRVLCKAANGRKWPTSERGASIRGADHSGICHRLEAR